jgi:four helix bundle protein
VNAMSSSYQDLIVWQKTIELSEHIYKSTASFPKDELYGLVSQMRRASVSIASNIAEGQARLTTGEFRHFLGIARGSVLEVETQVLLSERLKMLDHKKVESLLRESNEIKRMLHGLSKSLERSTTRN